LKPLESGKTYTWHVTCPIYFLIPGTDPFSLWIIEPQETMDINGFKGRTLNNDVKTERLNMAYDRYIFVVVTIAVG
jgi:hypothetical protein